MFRKLTIVFVLAALPATVAMGQLEFFDSQDEFEQFNREHGKAQKGVTEDFENNDWPDNDVTAFPAPLVGGVANGPFPEGLRNMNLLIDTGDGGDLVLLTDGFVGAVTDVVGANTFADSTNLHFLDDDKTGIGFDLVDLSLGGMADISIYDVNDALIISIEWPSPFTPQFFGVWSDVPIGRINIAAQNGGGELLDNIQMWVPEPASLSLLLIGAVGVLRRR